MEPWGNTVVRQALLSDQVASQIRDQIVRQNLLPGDKLPSERELGEQFGVSRTVIREALKALSAKGLIVSRNGRGIIVAAVEASDVAESMRLYLHGRQQLNYVDLHEVRTVLETSVVTIASTRSSQEDTDRLLTCCAEMEANLSDIEVASRYDLLFHRALAQATHNEFYVMLHDVLGEVLMDTRRETFSFDPARMERVAVVHREIAMAVVNNEADRAAALMREHLDDVRETWERQQHTQT